MKPQHDRAMRRGSVDFFARTPSVRQIRPNQHQIFVTVGCNVIADIALAAAIERERELVFGMIVPFKGERFQAPVKYRPRTAIVDSYLFKKMASSAAALLIKVSLFAARNGKTRASCFPGE